LTVETLAGALGSVLAVLPCQPAWAQELLVPPKPMIVHSASGIAFKRPEPEPADTPLRINLPTALRLAHVAPIDIALASERIRAAAAQLERAQALWLPTVLVGVDYFRHDGQIQDVQGNIFGTSKSAFMAGAGPSAIFAVTDAIFEPLAERQVVRATEARLQTARNDTLLAVAEAYFTLQQARGELAGALNTLGTAELVARKTKGLARGLAPEVELDRVEAELAQRRQAVDTARERWRSASAELGRLLRLDATALLNPNEPPHLRVTLVGPDHTLTDLIPLGLTNRPELAGQQALVQATLQRLREEHFRPFVPSVLLRGASTNPAGTLGAGVFGGGLDESVNRFSARSDFDVQLVWELQNLGFGNRARIRQRRSEHQQSLLDLLAIQDRVAAEVAQAFAQVKSAASRMGTAEYGLKRALLSADKNYKGLGGTKNLGGNVEVLVIRPQEVVQALQALSQAFNSYYGAVADYNRAQFRLYRALGHPAQVITGAFNDCNACGSPSPSQPQGRCVTNQSGR
jgi:outer membrane protein TolC